MAAAVAGAGMAHVEVALVDHLEPGRGQGVFEAVADEFDAFGGHGRTRLKGLTVTRW